MRELSPDPLPRDHLTIWVSADTWLCPLCTPDGGDGAYTSVSWIGLSDGPDGRCSTCGLKLRLAASGEHVPDPLEQIQREAPE